ncbi:hypothetical protein J5N93_00120, partial [Pseudomonas aeruginosa]|nr:hypothetical protein [Pseudomonas aeruginosa]
DANGNFTAPLNPPLTNGETVTVIVTDPAGNNSTPVTAEAPDNTDAPQATDRHGADVGGTEAGDTEPAPRANTMPRHPSPTRRPCDQDQLPLASALVWPIGLPLPSVMVNRLPG